MEEALEFTIDTSKYYTDNCMGAIPFDITNQYGIELTINWGDGTIEKIDNVNRYTDYFYKKSYHIYSNPGIYRISIISNDWENTYMMHFNPTIYSSYRWGSNGINNIVTSLENEAHYFDLWHRMITQLHTKFPKIKGRRYDGSSEIVSTSSLINFFREYPSLTTINFIDSQNNNDIFDSTVSNIDYCFYKCPLLQSIPEGLLTKCTSLTSCRYCFEQCSSLGGFTLTIPSPNISVANNFVTKKEGVVRTIKVPANSTTYTTFNNLASSLGLTITTI